MIIQFCGRFFETLPTHPTNMDVVFKKNMMMTLMPTFQPIHTTFFKYYNLIVKLNKYTIIMMIVVVTIIISIIYYTYEYMHNQQF